MTEKLFPTFSGDIVTMFKERPELHDKLVRYWILGESKEDPDETCDFAYIRQIITVGGKTLIGLQPYESRAMYFYPPEKLLIYYFESDQK